VSDTIKAIVALADDVSRLEIESTLEDSGAVEVIDYSEGNEDLQAFLAQPSDVVIVACGQYSPKTTEMVDRAMKQRPDRPVVVLAQGSPNGLLQRAFEAGADDVVALPQSSEDIRFALEKVIARRRGLGNAQGTPVAPLICILGPKGGTGKTLVSANLAVALAQRDRKVVLVDLDLQFGDIGLSLGLAPERTIYDLAKAGPPYDHDKLDRHLMRHSSGVKVLVGPTRPDHASAISIGFLQDVYASLRTMCDVVVVDTPPGFTPEVIGTIDVSTAACMVGMLDALSLKNTKLGLETLELMGYAPGKISLVLNRADSRVGITHDDVSSILGRAPDVMIPSDREIPRSVNEGTPIVGSRERSDAAKAFRDLADIYSKPAAKPAAGSKVEERRTLMSRRRR
jgi:pilus assembly protein CpaE